MPFSSASPSLGPNSSGASPACRSACSAGIVRPSDADLADADHRCRHMRQRREITRCPYRALARDHRGQAAQQHRLQQGGGLGLHPRGTLRQAGELERHHQPDHRHRRRRAGTRGMAQHDIALQPGEIGIADAQAGEFSEAGVDAIDRFSPGPGCARRPQRWRRSPGPTPDRGGQRRSAINAAPLAQADAARCEHDLHHIALHTRAWSGLNPMR